MTYEELLLTKEASECVEVECYEGVYGNDYSFHTDKIKSYDKKPKPYDIVLEYELMDEDDYNDSVLANSSESADFAEWYNDENAMVLVVLIQPQESQIKKWRENAFLSRAEMSRRFEIPIRTLEDWEYGKSNPAVWAEKLIVEKLMSITDEVIRERSKKRMSKLKSDEDGRRPVGSWALIRGRKGDEWHDYFPSMYEAIEEYESLRDDKYFDNLQVAFIICNQTDDGKLESYYCDKNGNVESDYDFITL